MSLNRMPLFCFAMLAASLSLVFALPALTIDCVFLELAAQGSASTSSTSRTAGTRCSGSTCSGSSAIPRSTSSCCPRSGSRPRSSRPSPAAGCSRSRSSRWPSCSSPSSASASGHTTCSPRGCRRRRSIFFAAASMMVVIPSTIQIFAWTLTVDLGTPLFRAPLLFIGGFIAFFVLGGLSGIMFAAIPFDQAVDRHLLRRRPLPLHHLRRRGLPALRRDVLLVPEGHRAHVPRALGRSSFWIDVRGHDADVLPDAHRRAARDDAARLHLRERPRLGYLQPDRDDRRLRARARDRC